MVIKEILRKNNNRVTPERIALFEYLKKVHTFTYNDIVNNTKNIWRASVFRTLNLFLELWIIRKVEVWWKIMTYEINDEEHHHEHMKCDKCDCLISFESDNICKKIFKEAKKIWFEIKSHNIWIVWTCKNCSQNYNSFKKVKWKKH